MTATEPNTGRRREDGENAEDTTEPNTEAEITTLALGEDGEDPGRSSTRSTAPGAHRRSLRPIRPAPHAGNGPMAGSVLATGFSCWISERPTSDRSAFRFRMSRRRCSSSFGNTERSCTSRSPVAAPAGLSTRQGLTPERLGALAESPVYFQERIRGDDLRIYVLDGEVIGAAQIVTDALDFRGNEEAVLSIVADDALRHIAVEVARALGLVFSGVDVKRRGDGLLVVTDSDDATGIGFGDVGAEAGTLGHRDRPPHHSSEYRQPGDLPGERFRHVSTTRPRSPLALQGPDQHGEHWRATDSRCRSRTRA